MDDLQNPHVRFQRGLKGAQRGGHLCQRLFKQIKDVGRCMYTNMANWRRCRQKVKTQGKSKKQPDTKNLCQRWISFIPHTNALFGIRNLHKLWLVCPTRESSSLCCKRGKGDLLWELLSHQPPNTKYSNAPEVLRALQQCTQSHLNLNSLAAVGMTFNTRTTWNFCLFWNHVLSIMGESNLTLTQ